MKKYTISKLPIAHVKHASITLGLREGYISNSKEHVYDTVLNTYKEWIANQLQEGDVFFPAFIETGYFVYGFLDSGKNQVCNSERAVKINIEINKEYHQDIFDSNDDILSIITALAGQIGSQLKQERVHIEFNNNKYILE